MKKPDEKKTTSNPKAPQADKAAEIADDTAKKQPAQTGTVKAKDVGAGDGKSAATGGGKIAPAESTLVGDGKSGRPPATAKPDASAAAAATAKAKAESTTTDSKAAPAEAKAEAAATKAPSKDAPSQPTPPATPASTPAPAQNVTVRKTGFWPVAFGGVVAAGLGAAATIWALPHLPAGWLPEAPAQEVAPAVDADAIRADAVSAAEAAAREQVEALRAELAEAAAATPAPVADTTAAPAAADDQTAGQIAELQGRLEQQAARIEELAARPTLDADAAQKVQSLADQAAALEQQILSAAQNAQSEITAAQAEAQKLQEAAEDSTKRAEAVAAIASLQAALDRGVTPEEARSALEGAGIDPPEALAREVPSLESLQAGFGDAARAALRASLREDSTSGGNVLTNFLRAQTGVRSVAPREGDDADAVLSRANAEIEAGRIDTALDEMQALSDAAKSAPAMADWLAGATAYRDARSALSDLSANSN